jgi:hypothetical protein
MDRINITMGRAKLKLMVLYINAVIPAGIPKGHKCYAYPAYIVPCLPAP